MGYRYFVYNYVTKVLLMRHVCGSLVKLLRRIKCDDLMKSSVLGRQALTTDES